MSLLLFLLLCFSSNAFHPAPADIDEGGDHDADDHQEHGLGEVVFVIVIFAVREAESGSGVSDVDG